MKRTGYTKMRKWMNGLFMVLMALALGTCSKDDLTVPDSVPIPSPGTDKGEVTFEISSNGGTGSGTSTSPIEIGPDAALNMIISQKSRYTDSEGTTFECEPRAAITVSADLDTVFVETLAGLTDIVGNPEVDTSTAGDAPAVHRVNQKFTIGTQSVHFGLSYEVYTYDTADGRIEMPYMKPGEAVFGSAATSEAGTKAVVKSIVVKPLPRTRLTVSDTTWYEVTALFNLDVESANAGTEHEQNLTFAVKYLGAVTTRVELDDYVKDLSTTIHVLGGTSSTSSPYLVNPGETLGLLFAQNSSYTDAYGNKMSCEPEARINLSARSDTVYVTAKEELEVTPDKEDTEFSASGDNPVLYSATQQFKLGNQVVRLEMSYETFTATDAENQVVEMPYLKLNSVEVGEPSVKQRTTKAVVKSDTTFYDVLLPVRLEVADIGPADENIRTIEFQVAYVGAVVTELKDPVKELSADIRVLGGTGSTSSPFLGNPDEELSLLFEQNSSYTDAYGKKTSCSPQAKINLSVLPHGTVYAETKEELEGIPSGQDLEFKAGGQNPVRYLATQQFKLGTQTIQLDMSYETYVQKDDKDNDIEMPYLKINAVSAGAATLTETSKVTGSGIDTTFYKVQVPIRIELVEVGTADENKQTIECVAVYTGAVITVPELVKVEYRTGYVWEEAHHNLPLGYYAKVYRDRYYSNGEVITDEFVDNGHPVELGASTGINGGFPCEVLKDEDQRNDSIWTSDCVIAVDDMSTFSTEVVLDENDPGTWSKYVVGKLYEDNVNLGEENYTCVGDYENTSLQSGWYFGCFSHCQYFYVDFNGATKMTLYTSSRMYDQFLSIDGRIIDFLKYKPERHFSHKVEEVSFDTSKYTRGVKMTGECTTYYLGRKFYCRTVLTLYEKK